MPRVRSYGGLKSKREVVQAPTLRVQPPQEAFGLGGTAQKATDRALDTASDMVARAAKQQAEVEFQDIDGKLTAASLKIRLAFNDVAGNKARDQVPKSMEEFDKEYNKLSVDFSNNAVAAAAQRSYQNQKSNLEEGLSVTAAKKFKEYDQKSTAAFVQLMDEEAVQSFTNTGAVGRAIIKKLGALKAYAERNKISPDETQLLMREAASKTHRAVIERMLDNKLGGMAKEYLDTVKSEMLAGDLGAVEKPAQEGAKQSDAYKAVEKTFNQRTVKTYKVVEDQFHPGKPQMREVEKQQYEPDPPKTLNEWVKRINKELEGKDEDTIERAEARARRRWNDMEQERSDAHRSDINSVGDMIESGMPWDELPTNALAKLSFDERNDLKKFHDKKREGKEIETDWEVYRQLKLMASGADPVRIPGQPERSPEELKKLFFETNMSLYRHALSNSEYKEMIGLQAGIKKGDKDILADLEGYRTENQIIEQTMTGKGFSDKVNKGEADEIRRAADMEIYYWKVNNTDKQIPSQEVQKIIDGLLINHLEKKRYGLWGWSPLADGGVFGPDWTSADVYQREFKKRTAANEAVMAIARDVRLQITRKLLKEKKEVSSASIFEEWTKQQEKKINAR